jgi:hypothetical protein
MDEPTATSAGICRAKVFRVLRKLFVSDSAYMLAYEYVQSIDSELQELVNNFPWYFNPNYHSTYSGHVSPHLKPGYIARQHCLLHMAICIQRVRMNRPFLHNDFGGRNGGGEGQSCWAVCTSAAQSQLAIYRILRAPYGEQFPRSARICMQGYQIYAAAVTLAAFLVVEWPLSSSSWSSPSSSCSSFFESLRQDIDMVIYDLEARVTGSLAKDGIQALRKMLEMMHDRSLYWQEKQHPHRQIDSGSGGPRWNPELLEALILEISPVFGGEQVARKYFETCNAFVVGDMFDINWLPQPLEESSTGVLQENVTSVDRDSAAVLDDLANDGENHPEYLNQDIGLDMDLDLELSNWAVEW